ncbi:MAG: DUF5916 domain-containing protein [Bacteroidota bacterium]|mgnify:CR=1 FL=1
MTHFRLRHSALFVLLLTLDVHGRSLDPLKPFRTEKAPIIDGKLDDALWQQAPVVSGFKTFIPDFGRTMPESTHAYMAYDSDNLYFAFYCFDPEPSGIKAEMTARDNTRPHDWVCINLDSFNDQQSLYAFYVNPFGIQSDSRFAAGNEDFSVDMVWNSAGQITHDGYVVELQIPLKSIRYSSKNPVEMSVFFERRVARRSEHASFPELDPKKGFAFLTQMSTLVYPNLEPSTLFEILPAITHSQKFAAPQGNLTQVERVTEISLTAKYGITSDLILDATYNPDFSQIEADAGQVDVNLRYGLFFPEKRPFFLEGSENFNLSASGTVQVVHTRTIVNPLVGLKVSGKIGEKSRIATIYAVDELLTPEPGRSGTRAHFPILRYKYALGDESYVGAILTGRELENSFNRVVGTDASIRMTGSSTFDTQALFSQSKATDSADRTDGHAISLEYNHGSRDIDFVIGTNKVSQNFSSETGYVTRTGILSFNAYARPKFYPGDFLRRVDVLFSTNGTRDELSSLWETYNEVAVINIFSGGQSSRFSYFHSTEIFLGERFKTGGFLVSGGGQFTNEINFSLQYRRANAIFFSATPYQGSGSRATASLVFQPWNQLEINSSITYVDFFRSSDNEKIYEYPISRLKLTYQLNKYLFVRGIAEYNKFNRALLNDFLISFTYIPGTVFHVGYGSQYKRTRWESGSYVNDDDFFETRRGFFFKMSYLWRS